MTRRTWGLLALAVAAAGLLSLFASASPDGLERVLADRQIASQAPAGGLAPLPDYQVPALASPHLSGSLAGLIGTAVALAAAWAAFRLLAGRGSRRR